MNIFKTVWQFFMKKNVVSQNYVPQEVIKAFAQKLDDLVKFDVIFKGKFAFLEKYDGWAFEQIITGFLALVGGKIGLKAINLVQSTMMGFNSGNYEQAKKTATEFIASSVNFKKVSDDLESIVITSQVAMLFDVMDHLIDKQQV
jgi:hypothetical protein